MPDKFAQLALDLERLRETGFGIGMFGEDAHGYELNPPLTKAEVLDFETQHRVHLPDDYRLFLLRVGNGGAGPYYGLFKLGEMDDGDDFGPWDDFIGDLSAPFPHTAAWNDLAGKPDFENHENEPQFDALLEAFEKRYYDTRQVNGAIPICHLGCARRQWLVITGPEVGNIWSDDRADYKGLQPLQEHGRERVTFFDWYRAWVDEALNKQEALETAEARSTTVPLPFVKIERKPPISRRKQFLVMLAAFGIGCFGWPFVSSSALPLATRFAISAIAFVACIGIAFAVSRRDGV